MKVIQREGDKYYVEPQPWMKRSDGGKGLSIVVVDSVPEHNQNWAGQLFISETGAYVTINGVARETITHIRRISERSQNGERVIYDESDTPKTPKGQGMKTIEPKEFFLFQGATYFIDSSGRLFKKKAATPRLEADPLPKTGADLVQAFGTRLLTMRLKLEEVTNTHMAIKPANIGKVFVVTRIDSGDQTVPFKVKLEGNSGDGWWAPGNNKFSVVS